MSDLIQPLADALLVARRPDGTWPEPLDWLAAKVLTVCVELPWPVPHEAWCGGCEGAGWVHYNPAALHWPEGWAYGLGWKWLRRHLQSFRNSRLFQERELYDVLGDALSDSAYIEGESDTIAALVEAVKAISEVPHE